MARSELLRRLFISYAHDDDTGFNAAARALIAEERRQNHRQLASNLEHALLSGRKPGAAPTLTLRPIPKGRDERPLVRVVKPERQLVELVLGQITRDAIEDVIQENLHRSVLAGHGLRPRRRLLFIGPPGTGKSTAAHAIAAELSLPVAVASLAALTSSFLGDTARNIESVMRFAEQTPCVLLFDEFDVLGQEREQNDDHGEMRRVVATLLQLLEEVQGESVIVATSNRPQAVDAALWRRFDELVAFDPLRIDQINELITLKLRGLPTTISAVEWARTLQGFSPAEIELICFDAMRRAVLAGHATVDDDALTIASNRMRIRSSGGAEAPQPCMYPREKT